MIANVDLIEGRKFVSSSGNVCTSSKLADGGIRALWKNKPSETDVKEYNTWASSIVDANVCKSVVGLNKEEEKEAYNEWRKNLEEGK